MNSRNDNSAGGKIHRLALGGTALLAWGALGDRALAIPSPDVVVNVFTGMAQGLVAIGAACAGLGAALLRGIRRGDGTGRKLLGAGMIALLLISLSWNWVQFTAHAAEREGRLIRNLARRSTQNGQQVRDVSLKELPFTAQVAHPLGRSTEEVWAALDSESRPLLVDVRELEEYASGHIRHTLHVRYPDLQLDPAVIQEQGREVVLCCYSGNRSGELAESFHELGFSCRFMVGGYEKWNAEGRPLEGRSGESSNARDIAEYSNRDRLLDTAEVEAEYANGDVVFLDARYPAEFESFHLPNSINFPLRKMTSEEVTEALATLPSGRRYVGACFDKRSSFYALLLGSKLSAAGHQWLGRYTLPGEFLEPSVNSDEQSLSLASVAAWCFARVQGFVPHAGWAIVVLVVALRLLLAPLSLRAEASTAAERRSARQIDAELQGRGLRGAEARVERARLLREAGVRPVWGLLSGLAQLVVFLTVAGMLSGASAVVGVSFLWLADLGVADPTFLLPLAVSLLAVAQMRTTGKFRGRRGALISGGTALLFLALTATLSAAMNLAIACNVALSLCFAAAFLLRDRQRQKRSETRPTELPVSLRAAVGFEGVGPKALRLSQLRRDGLPVPDGFVLPHGLLRNVRASDDFSLTARAAIRAQLARLGVGPFAVRSSALDEDGAEKSFAGIFESVLDVPRHQVGQAIDEVLASFESERAKSYRGSDEAASCILVQRMVDAQYAGVVFTRHPRYPAEVMVEYVDGCGEALVSGAKDPQRATLGRRTLQGIEGEVDNAPFPMRELVRLALRCEELFGRPQDVEWAYRDGRFYVVQSRDITAGAASEESEQQLIERERSRVLELLTDDTDTLRCEAFSELLPTASPASLSLVHRLLGPQGAAAKARRRFGMPYAPDHAGAAVVSVFGRVRMLASRSRKLYPRGRLGAAAELLSQIRLERATKTFDERWMDRFAAQIDRYVRMEGARDLSRLESEDLAELLEERVRAYTEQFYVPVEELNLVAARQDVLARSGHRTPEASAEVSVTTTGIERLRRVGQGELPLSAYLQDYGHRAATDYELALPRFSEDPSLVRSMADSLARADANRPIHPVGAATAGDTGSWTARKETARHHVLKVLALVREACQAVGRLGKLGEDVFFLRLDEIGRYARDEAARSSLERAARARRRDHAVLLAVGEVDDLESMDAGHWERLGRRSDTVNSGALRGACVFGDRPVLGRARVLEPGQVLTEVAADEILVARHTDTSLAPLFSMARGLVTEVGGMLSHAAIVAREFGLPAVVGVSGALRRIQSGDLIELRPDGQVVHASTLAEIEAVEPVRLTTSAGARFSGRLIAENENRLLVQFDKRLDLSADAAVTVKVNGYEPSTAKGMGCSRDRSTWAFQTLPAVEQRVRTSSA